MIQLSESDARKIRFYLTSLGRAVNSGAIQQGQVYRQVMELLTTGSRTEAIDGEERSTACACNTIVQIRAAVPAEDMIGPGFHQLGDDRVCSETRT
jgi:hypothetical protein